MGPQKLKEKDQVNAKFTIQEIILILSLIELLNTLKC